MNTSCTGVLSSALPVIRIDRNVYEMERYEMISTVDHVTGHVVKSRSIVDITTTQIDDFMTAAVVVSQTE